MEQEDGSPCSVLVVVLVAAAVAAAPAAAVPTPTTLSRQRAEHQRQLGRQGHPERRASDLGRPPLPVDQQQVQVQYSTASTTGPWTAGRDRHQHAPRPTRPASTPTAGRRSRNLYWQMFFAGTPSGRPPRATSCTSRSSRSSASPLPVVHQARQQVHRLRLSQAQVSVGLQERERSRRRGTRAASGGPIRPTRRPRPTRGRTASTRSGSRSPGPASTASMPRPRTRRPCLPARAPTAVACRSSEPDVPASRPDG